MYKDNPSNGNWISHPWIKYLVMTKLTALFMLAGIVFTYASGHAQTVTLSSGNITLSDAFKEIRKQTGYNYLWSARNVASDQVVSVSLREAPVEEAIEHLIRSLPLTYQLEKQTILIKERPRIMAYGAASLATPAANLVLAHEKVTGRVVDSLGQPLAGASVRVLNPEGKRTTLQTKTDQDGYFELKNVPEDAVLEVTFIGYFTRTIKPRPQLESIILQQATSTLDETIVQAYGTTTRRLNTGNIARVGAEEIARQPVSNPLAALQGKIAGLNITQSSGVPGAIINVEIRGRSFLDANLSSNQPLFIIDGVPFAPGNDAINQLTSAANVPGSGDSGGISPFSAINPSDIESIEVLKDADATAIYGSRGANGVILITTKKSRGGNTEVTINTYTGLNTANYRTKFLDTEQYLAMRREAFENDGREPTVSTAPDLLLWDQNRHTDWRKELIGGTGVTNDVQLSLSGGAERTQYLLGGTYRGETTLFPGSMGMNRGAVNLSVSHRSSDERFAVSASAIYSGTNSNLNVRDLTWFVNLPPNHPALFDEAGNLRYSEQGVTFPRGNPYTSLIQPYNSSINNMSSNVLLSYAAFPWLTIKGSVGYNFTLNDEYSASPSAANDPQYNLLPSAQFGNTHGKSWIVEPQVEFRKDFGPGFLNILVGGTWQSVDNRTTYIQGSEYQSDLLLHSVAAAGRINPHNNYSLYRYTAAFGRINYNIANRYILNLTGRRDGSSRFGSNNRFANFGAIGAAWIFSDERLIADAIPWLSFGKLRTSYGITGNDQIGNYLFLDTWVNASNPYQGISGLRPSRLFNPDYQWEANRKMEIGLELGFLKDRLLLNGVVYQNRSSNQLTAYKLPYTSGFASINRNMEALVDNSGYEVVIQSQNIKSSKWSWNSSLNVTVPRTRLLRFPGLETSSYATRFVIGEPLNLNKTYRYEGVDPETGIFRIADDNDDGILNTADRVAYVRTDPVFYGGLQNDVHYKNWQLSLFLTFRRQTGSTYLKSLYNNRPGMFMNQPEYVLDRWQAVGDHTDIAKFISGAGTPAYIAGNNFGESDGIYGDASFIRGQNIYLAYSLDTFHLGKMIVKNLKFYSQVQNVFTISRYKGADPETQTLEQLPPLRTISFGIQIKL